MGWAKSGRRIWRLRFRDFPVRMWLWPGCFRFRRPLAVGLNCALGATLMRPYIQELSRIASDTYISCYPNAGLPNPMSDTGFDETPADTSRLLHAFAAEGLVNIVGGCCGTTPDHIGAIGEAVRICPPRRLNLQALVSAV